MNSYVLGFQEIDKTKLMVIGAKGANLGELSGIECIRVPEGFCVTTEAFKKIIGQTPELNTLLDQLSLLSVGDREKISEISARFAVLSKTLNDVQALVKYANNKNIADNLRDIFPNPYTEQDAINFLTAATEENEKQCLFAIDIKGEAIGGIGISLKDDIHRKSTEIGYWLAEPYWSKGIITAAIRRKGDCNAK